MDNIKEAFNKVKEDIFDLKSEIEEIKKSVIELCEIVQKIAKEPDSEKEKGIPAHSNNNQTHPFNFPAHNSPLNVQKAEKQPFSTGNEGVPADRQTNQQTDRQTKNAIENAAEMLKNLDVIKREIRLNFKKLTEQEWLVFSTIFQLEDEIGYSDYRILSGRLKLTESSIRDYVARLIKKGIPVNKTKLNNKNVRISISPNLKQIATLPTLLTLRDI